MRQPAPGTQAALLSWAAVMRALQGAGDAAVAAAAVVGCPDGAPVYPSPGAATEARLQAAAAALARAAAETRPLLRVAAWPPLDPCLRPGDRTLRRAARAYHAALAAAVGELGAPEERRPGASPRPRGAA